MLVLFLRKLFLYIEIDINTTTKNFNKIKNSKFNFGFLNYMTLNEFNMKIL